MVTGERVIAGFQLRAAREWVTASTDLLEPWTCAERVLVTVGLLVGDAAGGVLVDVLAAAIAEPDTVECALTLLADAGLPCA